MRSEAEIREKLTATRKTLFDLALIHNAYKYEHLDYVIGALEWTLSDDDIAVGDRWDSDYPYNPQESTE